MLKNKKNTLLKTLSKISKSITIIVIGTIIIHFIVTYSRYFIFSGSEPVTGGSLIKNIFSGSMIPILIAYALLIFTAYSAWNRMKLAMIEANQMEIQAGKEEAIIQTTQFISGLMAEHIANYNNDIKEWLEIKKGKGQQVPEKIEKATDKISKTLETLSQTGFIYPYTENKIKNIDHYIEYLQENLKTIAKEQD